jgi:nucleotide-binding universal stress UspA family protein
VVSEEAQSAHLVVIGAHEPGGFTDVLRATFRERLVSESRSPILVVRSPTRGPYARILLALDGSHATRNVITAAESLLVDAQSELAVVHAHEPPYEAMMNSVGVGNLSVARYASASMTQAAEMIQAELQQHSRDARRYRVMLADARPGVAIREAVREMKPEVLVLGTRGHGRIRRAVLGSTAHEVLEKSECDVLLVPDAVGRA